MIKRTGVIVWWQGLSFCLQSTILTQPFWWQKVILLCHCDNRITGWLPNAAGPLPYLPCVLILEGARIGSSFSIDSSLLKNLDTWPSEHRCKERFNMTIGAVNASYIVQIITILDLSWINQFQVLQAQLEIMMAIDVFKSNNMYSYRSLELD